MAELGTSSGGGLYAIARGLDDRDVSPDRELKSVSVEDTFAEDLLDPATIGAQMDRLVSRLGTRLRSAGRSGRTISIKVRGHDFTTVSRSETAVGPTDDPAVIRAAAHRMLPGAVAAATAAVPGIRLLGVGVSALAEWAQLDLFAEIEAEEELLDEDDLEPQPVRPAAAGDPGRGFGGARRAPVPAGAGRHPRRVRRRLGAGRRAGAGHRTLRDPVVGAGAHQDPARRRRSPASGRFRRCRPGSADAPARARRAGPGAGS
ncbi:MAG: hypothetical protein AUG49_13250 [Catenulispora sp. 13_1_20CM_3_70_7]|nr:MAG: hypothetical protein AUG49_13250 [Catenulispora sp. 13_1_20CM_3_70_7]